MIFYQQKQLPIFQNHVYDTEAEAKSCLMGDVQLVEDQQTGLVYNVMFNPALMTYDNHYQNEQAYSPLFRKHLESVSHIINNYIGHESLIEVGCGKGFFLEMLLAKKFDVTGFDPAYEGDNPRVMQQYFDKDFGINAKGLILRHVLEHIQDPFTFLLQLKEANSGNGRIYIEVPCFDWICEHRAWFDIFYEHVNYFRISDFYRIFGSVIKSGHLFGGQYLFVIADMATLRKPEINLKDCIQFPKDFTRNLTDLKPYRTDSTQQIEAVWGSASKGVIFALLRERMGKPISTVIDINPAKQGKYLPVTGLLVRSPSDILPHLAKGSTIYIMNLNYLEEIKQMSNNAFNYIGVEYESFSERSGR